MVDAGAGAFLLSGVLDCLAVHGQTEGLCGPALVLAADIYFPRVPFLPPAGSPIDGGG